MLFKNDTELQQYAALSQETFAAAASTIENVELKHLLPLLGKALFTAIQEGFKNDNLTEDQKKLLEYARRVVGPWVCVYFAPKTDVKLSEAGARRAETQNLKTAYQYQLKNFLEANKNEALQAEESLLLFLEENAAKFPQWESGEERKLFKSLFIKTATEFDSYFKTQTPHTNFLALKSTMADVEELIIKKNIGETIFEILKQTSALSEVQTTLLQKIKKAVAALSIAEALPFINLRLVAGEGLTAGGGPMGSNDSLTSRSPGTDLAAAKFKKAAAEKGRMWLDDIKAFIAAHPEDFPQPTKQFFSQTKSVFGLK